MTSRNQTAGGVPRPDEVPPRPDPMPPPLPEEDPSAPQPPIEEPEPEPDDPRKKPTIMRAGGAKETYAVYVTSADGEASVLQVLAASPAEAEAVARETLEPNARVLEVEQQPLSGQRAADIGLVSGLHLG